MQDIWAGIMIWVTLTRAKSQCQKNWYRIFLIWPVSITNHKLVTNWYRVPQDCLWWPLFTVDNAYNVGAWTGHSDGWSRWRFGSMSLVFFLSTYVDIWQLPFQLSEGCSWEWGSNVNLHFMLPTYIQYNCRSAMTMVFPCGSGHFHQDKAHCHTAQNVQ